MSLHRSLRRSAPSLTTVAFLLVTLTGPSARATPITYEYSGVITSADSSTGVAPGTRFTGMFTYDPQQPTGGFSDTADYNRGFFGNAAAGSSGSSTALGETGLSLDVGGHMVASPQGGLEVDVDASSVSGHLGYGQARGLVGPFTTVDVYNTTGDNEGVSVALELTNPSRAVFGLLSIIPTSSVLTLADFPTATLLVTAGSSDTSTQTLYTGTIDSLTVVPEPSIAPLLCVAVAGWLAHSARRRSRGCA